jgi:hypothetical protein
VGREGGQDIAFIVPCGMAKSEGRKKPGFSRKPGFYRAKKTPPQIRSLTAAEKEKGKN